MAGKTFHLHVPLDGDLHQRLHRAASAAGKPATEVAREAIESALAAQRRREVHEALATYARAVAGTEHDLDPVLERAAREHLAEPKRRRS